MLKSNLEIYGSSVGKGTREGWKKDIGVARGRREGLLERFFQRSPQFNPAIEATNRERDRVRTKKAVETKEWKEAATKRWQKELLALPDKMMREDGKRTEALNKLSDIARLEKNFKKIKIYI